LAEPPRDRAPRQGFDRVFLTAWRAISATDQRANGKCLSFSGLVHAIALTWTVWAGVNRAGRPLLG
jgi:hypothetical protein